MWVQDYQLQLVPKMLRMLRPDLTIGFFLHIPFPPVELFMQMPWRTEIIEGLLGADLVGFHLPGGAQNFLILARRLVGRQHLTRDGRCPVPIRRGAGRLPHRQGRRVPHLDRLRRHSTARPATGASASAPARSATSSAIRARSCSASTGSTTPRASTSGCRRSRSCSTKAASSATTPCWCSWPRRAASGSRATSRCASDIERQVGHINGEYGEVGHPVVHYLHRPVPRDELIAFFVAADVMLVTPLRDGMNLVAKEYVACRSDLGGALVLSEFTGAAAELRQAYLVNPHDLDGVKDAIEAALNQDPEEGRRRMRALRRQVLAHDVDRWARSFLDALAATRAAEDGSDRGDVVDQPLAVDLDVVHLQSTAVIDRLLGLVGHGAVQIHHDRARIPLRGSALPRQPYWPG